MNIKESYDRWAKQYDSDLNKTRDLEGNALKEVLAGRIFHSCLEVGCGTGKNTAWLIEHANKITAIDFSQQMLAIARNKIISSRVTFIHADILNDWSFVNGQYDLITFSLILEHIEDLNDIFRKASACITTEGFLYIGELHPFKQYAGSKARFDHNGEEQILTCYNHNISDFITLGKNNSFKIIDVSEYFDDNEGSGFPRILTILLQKEPR